MVGRDVELAIALECSGIQQVTFCIPQVGVILFQGIQSRYALSELILFELHPRFKQKQGRVGFEKTGQEF